jgi:FKBP-type peptidyl-prolyl cis-trans isomerase
MCVVVMNVFLFRFHIGQGEVFLGLDDGVKGMKRGGVRYIRITSHLCYGGKLPKVLL